MSATINSGKLKFSVFGNGFDQVRNDSGSGIKVKRKQISISAYTGVIDSTKAYFWLGGGGFLKKYDADTLEEVEQTTIPDTGTLLLHPCNIDNNYGVAYQRPTIYIFDLTNDTIIKSGDINPVNWIGVSDKFECILVDDELILASKTQGRSTNLVFRINTNTWDVTETRTNNIGFCGFINTSQIYAYYPPEWFSDWKRLYSVNLDGSYAWNSGAPADQWTNIGLVGWGANGFLWIPSNINGAWRIGKYANSGSSDFATPTPLKTFGEFETFSFSGYSVAHDDAWAKTAFTTTEGLWVCDYSDVIQIDEEVNHPFAVKGNVILGTDGIKTKVFVYRY